MLRLFLVCVFFIRSSVSTVIINEVADKGTSNACPKQDWVELHNTGSSTVALAGFKLHDNTGPTDSSAYVFPAKTDLAAGAFLVLCTRVDATSPQFEIGGDDTITLRNPAGDIVSTSGTLPNKGEYGLTWAYNSKTSKYVYTSTPTPLKANVFTERRGTVSTVIINEVADKGTSNACPDNQDWVELHNTGSSAVALAGFKLHDKAGPGDSKAYVFPAKTELAAGAFLVLCTRVDATSPQFKIGGDDKITLRNPAGDIVSTSGTLPNKGEYDLTWAYNSKTSTYVYTSTPTPRKANVFTESWPTVRARLAKQHDEGEAFFGFGNAKDRLPAVVKIHLTMSAEDWEYHQANASYEVYKPFTGLKITSEDGAKTYAETSGGGRARPRGQSTLAIPFCMGEKTIPWLVDMTAGSDKTQRVFGMEKFYLRNHLMDPSYMREWTMHRMLRRFDLAYLRTRTAKLYINGDYLGLYSLMEAPDQDYVFYRSFGVDSKNSASTKPPFADGYAMYKVKTYSLWCGEETYKTVLKTFLETMGVVESAADMLSVPADPKHYAFKRGEHRDRLPVLKDGERCGLEFFKDMGKGFRDVMVAWIKKDKNCGKMLVDNDLIDRYLGGSDKDTDNNDGRMVSFINNYLSDRASKGCRENGDACDADTGIYATLRNAPKVDVDQWLKNFAVYAVTVGQDSPVGNGNNYFLASPGGSTEAERAYRLAQYDHNNAATVGGSSLCAPVCGGTRGIYWSIARPTCRALADNPQVGPLLAGEGNKNNTKKYLAYVKDFNENVYTNAEFIAETEAHALAIAGAVKDDPGRSLAGELDFDREVSAERGKWQSYNLLAFMKARGEEVTKQLAALEAGTFPRLDDQVPNTEVCQDWRSSTPANPRSKEFEHNAVCTELIHKGCEEAATCFDENVMCDRSTGDFAVKTHCTDDLKLHCKACFPHSTCGTSATTLARAVTIMMLLAVALRYE